MDCNANSPKVVEDSSRINFRTLECLNNNFCSVYITWFMSALFYILTNSGGRGLKHFLVFTLQLSGRSDRHTSTNTRENH